MKQKRTVHQVACDGVRAVWQESRTITQAVTDIQPSQLSIDGVVLPGTVQDVAKHMHQRDIVQALSTKNEIKPAPRIAKLIGSTVDGIRLPLKPVS